MTTSMHSALRNKLATIASVTAHGAHKTALQLPTALAQLQPWAAPKLASPTALLLTSSSDLRHYLLLQAIQIRFRDMETKVASSGSLDTKERAGLETKLDEFYCDEIMRWVPSAFDHIHIRIDPVNEGCSNSVHWAGQLASMYDTHAQTVLHVPVEYTENDDDLYRRKWGHARHELEIPQRYDDETGQQLNHSRKPAQTDVTRITRNQSMFWAGWYLNEGGIHVKVPKQWNGSWEGVAAAKVQMNVWGLSGQEFGGDEDAFMLNPHDIFELPSDEDPSCKTLVHLPTGLISRVADDDSRQSALVTLFKRLYEHDKLIAGGRATSSRGMRHSVLMTYLNSGNSLQDRCDHQVVRIYADDRVDDLVSGYCSVSPKSVLDDNAQAFHEVLDASLQHHARSAMQRLMRALMAVALAEQEMHKVV